MKLAVAVQVMAATAQDVLRRQVVSTFIYTTFGDRTPLILPEDPVLTPLGAQQLYQAGTNFRHRYVTSQAEDLDDLYGTISNISPYQIPASQLTVASRDEQYISAGAAAFMQGLYPPLADNSNYTFIAGQSALANGTNVVAPLRGYQYPQLSTYNTNDLNHIFLDGSANCPYYTTSGGSYYDTEVFQLMENNSAQFYLSLYPDILEGVFQAEDLGYFNSWAIYDYLQYAYIHNQTVADTLAEEDLVRARILATNWVMAVNANTSSPDQVGVISGRTLASSVLNAFSNTIQSEGETDKMTLVGA
jgi:hypothetical protein